MKDKKWTSVTLETKTVDVLKTLKHPGQSLDGIIQEIIEKVKNESSVKS